MTMQRGRALGVLASASVPEQVTSEEEKTNPRARAAKLPQPPVIEGKALAEAIAISESTADAWDLLKFQDHREHIMRILFMGIDVVNLETDQRLEKGWRMVEERLASSGAVPENWLAMIETLEIGRMALAFDVVERIMKPRGGRDEWDEDRAGFIIAAAVRRLGELNRDVPTEFVSNIGEATDAAFVAHDIAKIRALAIELVKETIKYPKLDPAV